MEKLNFVYLAKLAALCSTSFLLTNCQHREEPAQPPLTFTLQVAETADEHVKVQVTPSSETSLWYASAVEQEVYDVYPDPSGFVGSITSELRGELNNGKSPDELLYSGTMEITVDGLEEEHNRRRYLKNGEPTFDRIVKNISLLDKLAPDIRVNIRVNIDSDNMNNFVHIFDYFYQKHYTNIVVTPGFVEDQAGDNNCAFNSEKKFSFLTDLFQKYGIDFNSFYPSYGVSECSIRNSNVMVIGPEGEIYKCWNDVGRQDRIIGDVWGKISNKKLLLQYLIGADLYDDPQCKECILLPVCSGGCPYKRIMWQAGEIDRKEVCPIMNLDIKTHLWLHYLSKKKHKSTSKSY